MIPDVERVVIAYLKAEGLGAVIVGETPANTDQQWVKVTQIGDRPVSGQDSDHFNATHLQLDCYASEGGPQFTGEASGLYRAVRSSLLAMPNASHSGMSVTAVRFGSGFRLPDDSFDKPRQRFILDAFVYGHETP